MITIELLRRVGLPEEWIAKILERERHDATLLRQLRNRNYRKNKAERDARDASSVSRDACSVSQRHAIVDSNRILPFEPTKFSRGIESKKERKEESLRDSRPSAEARVDLDPTGPHDFESEDGHIRFRAPQIEQWKLDFPTINIRAQLRSAFRIAKKDDPKDKNGWCVSAMSEEEAAQRFVKGMRTRAEKQRQRAAAKPEAKAAAKLTAEQEYDARQRRIEERDRRREERRLANAGG